MHVILSLYNLVKATVCPQGTSSCMLCSPHCLHTPPEGLISTAKFVRWLHLHTTVPVEESLLTRWHPSWDQYPLTLQVQARVSNHYD